MISHRRGYKNRPACAAGTLQPIVPASLLPEDVAVEPPIEPPAFVPLADDPAIFDSENSAKAGSAQYPEPDAEEIARRLNAQRLALGGDGPLPPDVDMSGFGGPPASPPPDWVVQSPEGEIHVSQAREAVSLPVTIRVFYDWARQEGWFQGDGSLSAFVTDCLLDHFGNCLGKVLVVADREEVRSG
jgi:hypothetical protein